AGCLQLGVFLTPAQTLRLELERVGQVEPGQGARERHYLVGHEGVLRHQLPPHPLGPAREPCGRACDTLISHPDSTRTCGEGHACSTPQAVNSIRAASTLSRMFLAPSMRSSIIMWGMPGKNFMACRRVPRRSPDFPKLTGWHMGPLKDDPRARGGRRQSLPASWRLILTGPSWRTADTVATGHRTPRCRSRNWRRE